MFDYEESELTDELGSDRFPISFVVEFIVLSTSWDKGPNAELVSSMINNAGPRAPDTDTLLSSPFHVG